MKSTFAGIFEVLGFISFGGLVISGLGNHLTWLFICCGAEFLCFWISAKLSNKPFIRKE